MFVLNFVSLHHLSNLKQTPLCMNTHEQKAINILSPIVQEDLLFADFRVIIL